MATTYYDPGFQCYALQARTSEVPAAVDDVTGEDLRTILELYTEGIVDANSYVVAQNSAGASMNVEVGSGTADTDKAIVAGDESGQGNYLARMVDANDLLTVPAADVSNPRIDEVYLVVLDTAYDATTFVKPRLAYRDGTPAATPAAPGPDAAWDAFLLLASIAVAANEDAIETAHITDERVGARPVINDGPEFGGADETVSDSVITTTFEDGASVVFTKPFGWTTYKLMAWGSVMVFIPGSTAASARVSIGGNVGTAIPNSTSPDQLVIPLPARHERTGLTTDVTVVIQYNEVAGSSGEATKLNSQINFLAVRTS